MMPSAISSAWISVLRATSNARIPTLAENRKFFLPPLILRPRSGWLLSNLWKSFTDPETRVFQAAKGEDLVILACIIFDWSTRVTEDGETNGQTELRWLSSNNYTCIKTKADDKLYDLCPRPFSGEQ